ncbi:MAG: hypothetical protein GF365_02165 [Candidatus Buchananbacteria bacterium]|nr:hypothetical protein [Candidatus Buchananbacteria bacterium]
MRKLILLGGLIVLLSGCGNTTTIVNGNNNDNTNKTTPDYPVYNNINKNEPEVIDGDDSVIANNVNVQLMPLGFYTNDDNQKALAYLKYEDKNWVLYNYINGVSEKTEEKISVFQKDGSLKYLSNAVISPDGKKILYSYTNSFTFLNLVNFQTNRETNIMSGSDAHFGLKTTYFFNSESDEVIYSVIFADEYMQYKEIVGYNIYTKDTRSIIRFEESCEGDADDWECGGDDVDSIDLIPLGYASFEGQESVFSLVTKDGKSLAYKDGKEFVRYNVPVELNGAEINPQISNGSKYYFYNEDNKYIHKSSLGAILQGDDESGPKQYDVLLAEPEASGPHGGILSNFKMVGEDDVLYVDSSGDERCQTSKLYYINSEDKILIDQFNYCNE